MNSSEQITLPPFLIKFGKKKHMKAFIEKGEIYFNSFEWFRKIEEEESNYLKECLRNNIPPDKNKLNKHQKDKNEGLETKHSVDFVKINIEGEIHRLNTGVNFLSLYQNDFNNLLSLYSGEIDRNEDNGVYQIDDRMLKFGKYAVFINDPKTFIERIRVNYKLKNTVKKVTYIDKFNEDVKYDCFYKLDLFNYQNEFRIALENLPDKKINIGNIEDISKLVKSKDLLNIFYYKIT